MNDMAMDILQLASGILVESVIIGFVFQMISNKANQKSEKTLQKDLELIQRSIDALKTDLLNQIKESSNGKGKN